MSNKGDTAKIVNKGHLFDYIWDDLSRLTDDEFKECAKSCVIYAPYIPLQVSRIFVADKSEKSEKSEQANDKENEPERSTW